MLGKLLKHEWLSTWKVPTALIIYLCIITLLGCSSFFSPLWKIDSSWVGVLAGFSLMIYIFSLFAISITILVYFVVRFYRNLYTSEGYLMHTLPVKSWHHIVSKGLIYCVWAVMTVIAIVVSVLCLFASVLYSVADVSLHELMTVLQRELPRLLPEMAAMFQQEMGMSVSGYVFLMLLTALVGMIYAILIIYASISIGQTFNKHKVIASFIAYAVINIVLQLVQSFIQIPMLIFRTEKLSGASITVGNVVTPSLWINLVINLVCILAFYFLTEFLMRRKLNLD